MIGLISVPRCRMANWGLLRPSTHYSGRIAFEQSYRFRAKHRFGLSSVDEAFAGAVTVIQRFDSALRLNVHAHTLVLDGVYVRGAGGETLHFLSLPAPTEDEVHDVADRAAKRVAALLKARGRTIEGAASDEGAATQGANLVWAGDSSYESGAQPSGGWHRCRRHRCR